MCRQRALFECNGVISLHGHTQPSLGLIGRGKIITRASLIEPAWGAHDDRVRKADDKKTRPVSTTVDVTIIFKGILHQKNFYRLNLIFWIVMGCGIARFGRRGLKTTET